jgi:hypothetical protein
MRSLEREGLKWLYESYDLFHLTKKASEGRCAGYNRLSELFGHDRLQLLRERAGGMMGPGDKVCTPDLFAYRDDGKLLPVRFIELKRRDRVMPGQLLGLALIREILGTSIEIVRYVPSDITLPRTRSYPLPPVQPFISPSTAL